MTGFNKEKFLQMREETPAMRAVFNYLSKRQRHRGDMDLKRVSTSIAKENRDTSRESIYAAFKRLEDNDLGRVIVGRHGKPNRFHWNVDITMLAESITGRPVKKLERNAHSLVHLDPLQEVRESDLSSNIGLPLSSVNSKLVRPLMRQNIY